MATTVDVKESESESSEDDQDEDVVVENAGPYIKVLEDEVHLISPTFGDVLKIRKPKCRFGSSKAALKDLKHVEEQILTMGILPDFGYAEDNYILEQFEKKDKWQYLTGIIGNSTKFEWLIGFIKMSQF